MIRKIFEFLNSWFYKRTHPKRIEVVKETSTGKNIKFKDVETEEVYTAKEMRELIKHGEYPDYIVDKNGVIKSKPGVPNLG